MWLNDNGTKSRLEGRPIPDRDAGRGARAALDALVIVVKISLAPVYARPATIERRCRPFPRHGGRGAMNRPEHQPRIPAICALLLVATLLGIVWLSPLGSPSEAVSQMAP